MANQNVILVDGFVHNIGGRDDEMVERKNDALQRLQDANRWAALVRVRIAIDALGVWLMLRRWCVAHAAGAAVILAGHAMFWSPAAPRQGRSVRQSRAALAATRKDHRYRRCDPRTRSVVRRRRVATARSDVRGVDILGPARRHSVCEGRRRPCAR